MYKDIIWDFDGTLFDTYPVVSDIFSLTLEKFGIKESKELILKNLHISLSETYILFSKKYSLKIEELQKTFLEIEEKTDVSISKPFKDAQILLSSVKGLNFIHTNRNNSIYRYLDYWNYNKYFKEVITRDDAFEKKPNPDVINHFIEKYSLNPQTTLMVGDREMDISAAKNANIDSCYFNSHKRPIISTPDIYIENLIELLKYIK